VARFSNPIIPGNDNVDANIADFVFSDNGGNSSISLPGEKELVISASDDGGLIFNAGKNVNLNSAEDIYIDASDDIYLTAAEDDIHIRASDDIRFVADFDGEDEHFWRMDSEGRFQLPGDGYIENPRNSSGDGNNNDTLKIVPDSDLEENDQYIIIDPTEPNHIHIRAGGEQDNSNAELILGAERTNVVVSDYGYVNINTKRFAVANSYQNFNDSSTIAFVTNDINADISYGYFVNVDGTDYEISNIQDDTPFEGFKTIEASGAVFTAGQSYTFSYDGGENYWNFNNSGDISIPGGIYNPSEENELLVESASSLVLSGHNGEFLNDSESPNNQIATIGDLGVDTEFVVAGGTLGTQPTFDGDPLFTGSYVRMSSDLVHFRIDVDFDNITSFGTGQYYLDLPFPAKYNYEFTAGCLHDISESKDYPMTGHIYAGESRMLLKSLDASGNSAFAVPFTATTPVTIAVADNFHISGDYIADLEAP
jgi:hypothetical protein